MSYYTDYNLHLLDDLEMTKDKLLGAELRATCAPYLLWSGVGKSVPVTGVISETECRPRAQTSTVAFLAIQYS